MIWNSGAPNDGGCCGCRPTACAPCFPRCTHPEDALGDERLRGEYPSAEVIWFTTPSLEYCRWLGTAADGRTVELRRYTGEDGWTFTKYLANSTAAYDYICGDPESGFFGECRPFCIGSSVTINCGCVDAAECPGGCPGCTLCPGGPGGTGVFGVGACAEFYGDLPAGCVEGTTSDPCRDEFSATKRAQTTFNQPILNREFAYLDDELDAESAPIPRLTPPGDYDQGADFTTLDCCDQILQYWTYTPITVTIDVPPP